MLPKPLTRFEAPAMRVAVLLLLVVFASGCKTFNVPDDDRPSRLRPTLEPVAEDWDRYVYGPQVESVYVWHEHREIDGARHTIHWVYDERFQPLGYYTEYGYTFRRDKRTGDHVAIGNYTPELSMLKLTGGESPIVPARMTRSGEQPDEE